MRADGQTDGEREKGVESGREKAWRVHKQDRQKQKRDRHRENEWRNTARKEGFTDRIRGEEIRRRKTESKRDGSTDNRQKRKEKKKTEKKKKQTDNWKQWKGTNRQKRGRGGGLNRKKDKTVTERPLTKKNGRKLLSVAYNEEFRIRVLSLSSSSVQFSSR